MLLTKLYSGVCLLLAAVHIKENNALVEPLEYLPQDLQGYLDTCHSSGDLTQQSARLVYWAAINQYTSKFIKSRPDLSPQQEAYLRSNLEEAFAPLFPGVSGPRRGGRVKRQALGRRRRKEIRAMTYRERRNYFDALNVLKNSPSLPPNVYDFLSAYHAGDNIASAHFGPAFPSWHRLYLWILEYFLRLVDPTVTIPYWASVLDNDMRFPTRSVIWHSQFFGNGDGEILTGPFRNWAQINPETGFTRNVQDGELYTYDGIQRILSRSRNEEILIPTARQGFNYELQHGAAHVFVGGSMSGLDTAARDPVFFSHHCFVDQIWDRFRRNQSRNGIDPETDYPFNASNPMFRPQHNPTANAGFAGLSGASTWTQRLGYINAFESLVLYDPVPRCPSCGRSPYLFCNRRLRPARCVSRSIAGMRGRLDNEGTNSRPGRRVRRQTPFNFPQDASLDVCPRRSLLNDVETRWFGRPGPGLSSNTWAYIPVKVVTKRPEEYNEFVKYSLYNQATTGQLGFKDEFLKHGLQKRFESCEKFQDAVGKITIISHGLNYDGYAEEYVLTDNRLGVAEANGIIPVKMPTGSNPSEAIIAAFDSCGRVCKPYCKRGSSGAMATDSSFSGGIRVSYTQPRQFSNSYADALLNIWDVPNQYSCPNLNYDNIPVSFFCEYTDTWIWGSARTMPRQTPDRIVQGQGSHIRTGMHGGRASGGRRRRPGTTSARNNWNVPPHRAGVPFRGSSELSHLLPQGGRYEGRRARSGRGRTRRGRRMIVVKS